MTLASFELLGKCLLSQLVVGEEPGLVANCVGFAVIFFVLLGFFLPVICAFSCLMEIFFSCGSYLEVRQNTGKM